MLTKTSLIALLGVSLSCISSVLTVPPGFIECDTDTIKNKYKDTGKITYEHGPKKVDLDSSNFGLTTREYFVKIDETLRFNGTGYWKYTDSKGQEQTLSVSNPSNGAYTIIEYANGRKNTKQEWVFSLAAGKTYPTSESDYKDVKICTTCFQNENDEIVDYMKDPTGKSLPALKSCDAIPYWTGFTVPTLSGGPQPVSEITTFKWIEAKNKMKVVFNICPNGNACGYKSSSIHYIRLQSTRGTFVFWMAQDNTIGRGIKGTGVQSQTDREYTYKKDFKSLPGYLKTRLQGKNSASPATRSALGDDYVKVTVTHCWLKDGSQTELDCSASKEKEIERSDVGAAKK